MTFQNKTIFQILVCNQAEKEEMKKSIGSKMYRNTLVNVTCYMRMSAQICRGEYTHYLKAEIIVLVLSSVVTGRPIKLYPTLALF